MRHGKKRFARASKEVIICEGSVDSPKLLMLSGIGPKAHLNSVKVLYHNLHRIDDSVSLPRGRVTNVLPPDGDSPVVQILRLEKYLNVLQSLTVTSEFKK